MDAVDRLRPPLSAGERITLRLTDPARDLVGFVVRVTPLTLEDRHGRLHEVAPGTVLAMRRVGVSLGRDPQSAPRKLLDELASRAGLAGEPDVFRISALLGGLTPPAQVFAERGSWTDGVHRARVEGEWLTTDVTSPELLVELAWWAARQNARSVQVRS